MVVVRRSVQEVLIQRVHGCTGAGDGIGAHIQSEDLRELQYPGFYPASPMFVVCASLLVSATEEGAAYATGYTVVIGGCFK